MGEGLELKRGDKSAGSVLGKRIPGAMGMVPWWGGDKSVCVYAWLLCPALLLTLL